MNDLGMMIVAASIRAAILACLGAVAYAIARRRSPAEGAFAAMTTLTLLTITVALAPSPWPRWGWAEPRSKTTITESKPDETATAATDPVTRSAGADRPTASLPRDDRPSWGSVFAETFAQVIRQPRPEPEGRWRWPAWVAVAYIATAIVLTARLLLGVWCVRTIVARSRSIDDEGLNRLVATIRDEMAISRTILVRESREITAPATVGAFRPALLMPTSWREWDQSQRRAIVAHELAHVRRGDYAAGVWAQICLAINALQPLAYWMAGRFRLEQELVADAWGAKLSGGNRPYLITLARLAMGQDQRAMAWPSRAFLPVRGTLTRRIEMLRDSQPIDVFSRKPRSLAITAVGLAIACLTIAGVREPQAQATPPQQPAQAEGKPRGTIDLSAVPSGTGMMIAFRPGDILGKPGFETLETYIGPEGEITKQLGIQPVQVEQVTIVWLSGASDPRRSPSNPEPTVVIVRAAKAHDWTSWANADFVRGNAEQAQFAGETYTRSAGISDGAALLRPDDRTLIVASRESSLKLYLTARKVENPGRPWDAAWKAAGEGQAGIAIDSAFLAQMLAPMTEPGGRGPNLDAFSPLWTKAYAHAVKFNVGNTISLETASSCGTEDGAQQVARTMEAMVTIGTNMLTEMAQPAPGVPKPFLELVSVANEALGSAKVQRDGKLVNLRASSSSQIVAMVKNVLVPAVVSARSAARRAMSVNNLRQIGLAMFNYASAHDERFPPAVVMGPDGKTPHSWRVELLPYLDQNDLYLQYKMNEPWDSPANLKVLEQRPAIFAFSEGVPPTETSYFAVVGPETLFPNDGDGTAFRDITDGLSNTFLVVEAKRSIPWTKPEDIPLDKGQAVPDFGTYYPESPGTNMLLADGSVKFISKTIDAKMLRALFTRAGGEVVSFPR